MSRSRPLQRILARVKEKKKNHDWLGVVGLYEKAVDHVLKQKDFSKAGDVEERIGFCLYRAAMQAESQEEFKELMQRAIETYSKAHRFYEEMRDGQNAARMFRCRAVAKYVGYWLTSDPSEKRRLLDECLELEGEALAGFLKSEDMLDYGRTYNELSPVFFCRAVLEWDKQALKSIVQRGVDWGEKAVAVLSELADLYETAWAHYTLANCLAFIWDSGSFIAEPDEIDKYRSKVVKHLNKTLELSEKVGEALLLGWAHLWLGANKGGEGAVRHFEKALECGRRTRDNWLTAASLDWLTYMTYWKAIATEDPEKRREVAEDAMQFYEKGQLHCSIIAFMSARNGFIGPPAGQAEHYLQLAMWETNPEKRTEFLERSEKAGKDALKLAKKCDMPNIIAGVLHVVSKTLEARAHMEPEPTEKRSRLEKALNYREKTIQILEQLVRSPSDYWNLGVMQNYLAGIKAELADIEPDLNYKRRLLEEAVLNKERCVKQCIKMMPYFERMGFISYFAPLQGYQDTYATLLTQLYDLTARPESLRKAIETSQEAIESARKMDMVRLMAESYWKIAKAQDILGENLEAAENFENASEHYMKAAKEIPQLKDFYQDYASYMQAWSEIEKAKHLRAKRQYREAKERYEEAANLHKSTERWNYLSTNYLAWARLEEAEDLSRREQTKEAKDLFQQAANLFVEARKSIKAKLEKIEHKEEEEIATLLIKASDKRCDYCVGRIAVEEAKILDRQGDHVASSEKYSFAAETFDKIAKVETERTRKELKPLVYLCQAWQKMMMAEVKASPTIYGEAADLFRQAKEHTFDQPTSLLALANSSFCKALEAGTRFEATRDTRSYSAATQHLESAANYYFKASFKTASAYAKATQRLFDAYVYMNKAKKEIAPEKRAKYYMMAEKVLQTSASLYLEAKHDHSRHEVQWLLERVREERELAVSLSKVLHAPTIASSTASFITLTPSEEMAVGLERFAHVDVQARLVQHVKEIRVGEDFDLEMQIMNTGKDAVLLAKVEEILPAGFEPVAKPDYCHFEDAYVDMKGKRLDPLKTEKIKLVLRSFEKGTFEIKPRIACVGETGRQMFFEPEPVTINVSEAVLPGRITTGYGDLDIWLFGGIPENYAVILTALSCDERDMLIKRFLEEGVKKRQTTFYITTEVRGAGTLVEEFPSDFYLFICNPRAGFMIKSLPNVFKLQGVENLTEIGIVLIKAFRRLGTVTSGPRRACVEIISEVLLEHQAVQTRRWLGNLISDLKSRGFTTLAVMNPQMHLSEEVHAILGLFQGEISIYEKETKKGLEKFLKIKKMFNQGYLDSELPLKRKRLDT